LSYEERIELRLAEKAEKAEKSLPSSIEVKKSEDKKPTEQEKSKVTIKGVVKEPKKKNL